MRRITFLLLILTLFSSSVAQYPAHASVRAGSRWQNGQMFIYELNRARCDPASYGLPWVESTPPLALSRKLSHSAYFKVEEMTTYSYFAHQSPITGIWPNELARIYDYPLPNSWPDDTNYIESLAGGTTSARVTLDALANSASHRRHIFGLGGFRAHKEIGIGHNPKDNYWVVHTAYSPSENVFITGTVFEDTDGDGRFDAGEGLKRVKVRVRGGASTRTNAGGGYSLPVEAGATYVVKAFRADDGSWLSRVRVEVHDYNVQVDFVVGRPRGEITDWQDCLER